MAAELDLNQKVKGRGGKGGLIQHKIQRECQMCVYIFRLSSTCIVSVLVGHVVAVIQTRFLHFHQDVVLR